MRLDYILTVRIHLCKSILHAPKFKLNTSSIVILKTILKRRDKLCICVSALDIIQLFESQNAEKKKSTTVKILKFGTPQTIAIIVLKLIKFDVTLH